MSAPITNGIELGFTVGISALITKLNGIAYNPELSRLRSAAARSPKTASIRALAQFERAMISPGSRWDAAYAQVYTPGSNRGLFVDCPGFTAEENRGRALFMSNATAGTTCAACHLPPTFAINAKASSNGLDAGETTKFKAPSLKNVARSGAFVHDGRFATIDQVLGHYASGIQSGPALDNRFRNLSGNIERFKLSSDDKTAIVAFLRTLDDPDLANDPRFSSPFR